MLNDHAKVHMRFADWPGSTTVRVLRWGKANLGRAPEPVFLEQTEAGPFRVTEKPLDSKAAAGVRREKVRELLAQAGEQGRTAQELADEMGTNVRTMNRYLKDIAAASDGERPPRYTVAS